MREAQEIFVYLLDEGVDVWRPAQAQPLGEETFQILSENRDSQDQKWQFMTGDVVRCEVKELMEGTVPVARLVAAEKLKISADHPNPKDTMTQGPRDRLRRKLE